MIIWKFHWKNADLCAKLSFPLHLQDMILGFGEKKIENLTKNKNCTPYIIEFTVRTGFQSSLKINKLLFNSIHCYSVELKHSWYV